ncbi:hypothetical protein [Actinoplanes aureus]|uniref:Uncharacterized protein n=1 Tax=Actinoplanes aureus TaxID=2792083 RepID=A0A931G0C3_9ACTN|nr:hypothetical protein [Actinoplanes aureus]MBG0561254.1 hypothetical protein [Actinoplanes aureus]
MSAIATALAMPVPAVASDTGSNARTSDAAISSTTWQASDDPVEEEEAEEEEVEEEDTQANMPAQISGAF